jgi:peptide-methionine (R)-S-oxide reductase
MTWKDVIHYATKGNPVPDNIIVKTDNEWSAQLTPEQYQITRLKGTEQAFTGEHCATYETGNAVKYIKDTTNGMIRVEILCNTCDAHLGHVFPDGPEPSGLRFCVNSISIQLNKDE